MRKILLFTFLTAAGLLTATGAPLSPEESLKRLETQENLMRLTGNYHPTLIYTQQEESNEATLYIFNKGNNNGFMIVSADDCTAPLLGYTDQGNFNDAEIPEALKYWLEEYSRQIAYMREAGLKSTNRASSYKSYIAPLLSTAWGQTAPYNNYCYLTTTSGQTIECPTGCVATAMAQVMKYFEYPERGEGSISYTLFSNVPPLEMDFSEKPFEWSKMLDRYSGSYTAEEADAVAYLMKACGYSVKMSYNTDLSGAKSIDIAPAMIEYFKYSEATRYVKRAYYNADEWSDIIYNHLKGTGPVIYNGSSLTGGHSFVCDGYDGYGYFHINWGWDGMSNGYFLLDALEPSAQGTGGYAGGYNLNQDAVLAVPTSSEVASAQVYQYGSLVASVRSTTSLYFELTSDSYRGWTYYGSGNNVFDFGLTVEDLEGTEDTQYCVTNGKNVSLSNSQITYSPLTATISDLNLTEGKSYRMTLSTKQNGIENAEWIKVRAENGLYDYVIVTPTAEGLVISDNHIGNLVAESVEALSEIYLSSPVKFKAELSNPTQEQLTRNISAIFTDNDGNIIYRTGNICFTVSAGKSVVKEWSSDQWFGSAQVTEPTEYTLSLFDNDRNTFIEGASAIVTVNPVATQPDYTMTISLPDAIMENSTYILPTKNASVNLKINVQQGYYNGNVNLYVLSPISSSQYQTVYSQNLNEFVELKEGESGNYVIDLSFEGADPELRYMILAGDQY